MVRGGRVSELAAKKSAEDAEKVRLAAEQVNADLRSLLPLPAFRRMIVHWVRDSQLFAVPLGMSNDATREWMGRRALGAKLWNDVTAVDPSMAIEVLEQPSTPPKNG